MSPVILFDARALAAGNGGVPRVARRVLVHLRATRPDARIVEMTTGWKKQARDDGATGRSGPFGSVSLRSGQAWAGCENGREDDTVHFRVPNKLWSLACMLRLTSLDRVAARMMKTPVDALVLPNVGFIGIPRVPYTIVVHDVSFLIDPRWFSRPMRLWHRLVGAERLIRHAASVWCVSKTTACDVTRLIGVPPERITVLPAGIITGTAVMHEIRPARTAEPDVARPPYVMAFEGSPRKNAATAMATVARLREDTRFHDLHLILIGAAPHDPARPDWVIQKSRVTDAELEKLYRHASALLYPSWYEGFGLPLHEAARFGIPGIASGHGALPETAPSGTTFIPPTKPHLWVFALRNALLRLH